MGKNSDRVPTRERAAALFVQEQNEKDALFTGQCDTLVLDARLRQSLVAIRSFGRRGLRVAALETARSVPAFSSRWCRYAIASAVAEGSDDYLALLEQALDQTGARVVLSSSDGTIALLRQHRERLERRVTIALAKEPALSIAVNKEQTLAIAEHLGMHIPKGITVGHVSEVAEAIREIGLPAVIKPNESWVWGEQQHGARYASRLVTTLAEAHMAVEELTATGGTTLFQQFLTGRREALSFMYAGGEIYARFAQWAKRTEPPLGGTSVLRQSIPIPPDVGELSERLIREIDLEGYSEVEFRRDRKGIPYLMEINPRLSASVEIAVRSGVDFPILLYQWANGERIDHVQHYRVGGWMRYLKGDIMTTIETVKQRGRPGIPSPSRAMLGFFLSFFKPMNYDYLDWSDLTPAIRATSGFTRSWVGGAIQKRFSYTRRRFS